MVKQVFFFIWGLWFSLLFANYTFAAVDYIPAPKITLTGSTTHVRFDTAEVLYGSNFSGAFLNTLSSNFSGAFYIKNIGWALMSTGSYQVGLNCSIDPCQFTGFGWSENIGELGFANVRYYQNLGTLSGYISSFAGNFDVTNISLPLFSLNFVESFTGLTTDHAKVFHVQDSARYGNGSWSFQIIPNKNSAFTKYFSSTDGTFVIDLSFADTYTFSVRDPQGSITNFSDVRVAPGSPDLTLNTTSGLFIQDFCDNNPGWCPDGSARVSTEFLHDAAPKIADGSDTYSFTLKLRDQYGNWVNTGSVEIAYSGSIQNVQLPASVLTTNPSYNLWNNPLLISSTTFTTFNNTLSTTNLGSTPTLNYQIASFAPTLGTGLEMDHLTYTNPYGEETHITDTSQLIFSPPYTVSMIPPTSVVIGKQSAFSGTFSNNTSVSLSPEIIHLFTIGNGIFAGFSDLVSVPTGVANDEDGEWMIGVTNPSSLVLSSPSMQYSISGTYMPYTMYPTIEDLNYIALVHYNVGGMDIIYPEVDAKKGSEFQASRVKIIGQNNARSEYGDITTSSRTRTDFFNTLRKNIALLSRNRTNYDDVNYSIFESAKDIQNLDFDGKRTIVVIGADITIKGDIASRDLPVAIMALSDKNGNGGNIIIDPSVTEIYAGLFAEHSVLSSGDRQLVIDGSLISANTIGDTGAAICPYYVKPCVDPGKYDLENMRTYDGTDPSNASSHPDGSKYPGSALIIDYDMRLQTDSPPGLSQ